MQLDAKVITVAKRFEPELAAIFALPPTTVDDARRAWCLKVVEQVVWTYPGEGWGSKRADPGRPLSKDAIAAKRDGHLWCWDLVSGSTHRVNDSVTGEQIDGQVWVAVAGVNHLGTPAPDPTPGPSGPPPAPAPDLSALLARVTALEAALAARPTLEQILTAVVARVGITDVKTSAAYYHAHDVRGLQLQRLP